MDTKDWIYITEKPIRNYKDLKLEKQRLKLYQEFLGELISKDKELMKQSLHPKNIVSSAMMNFMKSNNKLTEDYKNPGIPESYTILFKLGKWLFQKMF